MSRRTDIADAAITTLAREGMRGLTHRTVDRTAGLPESSTSYYFPTRQALVKAVVERFTEAVAAAIPPVAAGGLDELTEVTVEVVRTLVTTEREHQLACYELQLEAARKPELRDLLIPASTRIRALVAEHLDAAGVVDPADRAHDFVAFLDGLMFDRLTNPGRELSEDFLRATVRALLDATVSNSRP